MGKDLGLGSVEVADLDQAMEVFWQQNWTDGFPVVAPTEEKVRRFLANVQLEPDSVVGEVPERATSLTAEMVAISAVMAGCLPEYMPVLLAAVRAVTDPEFHLNHVASMGSPWPLLIVNGPVVKKMGFNSGLYLFGPGNRPNATVGRALSLIMWNFLDAKPGGILRGCMGHPGRWAFCIAEDEETPWEPLHVVQGFDRNVSTVTAFPSMDAPRDINCYYRVPRPVLDSVAFGISGAEFVRGCYLVIVNPYLVSEVFAREGWSKQDTAKYLEKNTRCSVANLKRQSRWGWWGDYVSKEPPSIEPGDESQFIYLFHDPPGQEKYLDLVFPQPARERKKNIMLVVGGGNAGKHIMFVRPYTMSSNPVTKPILPAI